MKKKKIIIFLAIIIFVLLLIPIPLRLKDGGSVEYRAVLYKITKVKRLPEIEDIEKGYAFYAGYEIEILGFKVFDNTKLVKL